MKALVGAVMVMGVAGQSHAQVQPGKWRTDFRVSINGRDTLPIMAAFAKQVRTAMPTSINTNAGVGLNNIGNMGSATVCIPANVASTMTPAGIFNTFSKMNPLCTLVAGKITGGVVPFSGRCADPASFTGNVSGKLTVKSDWQWAAEMEGAGRFPDAVLANLNIPAKTTVMMKTTANTSRLAAKCP